MEWELGSWARRCAHGQALLGAAVAGAFVVATPAIAHAWWPAAIDALGGPRSFSFWAPFFVHAAIFWPMNIFYTALYVGDFTWAERYRVGRQPWAWKHPNAAERARFAAALRYALPTVLFNQLMQLVVSWTTIRLAGRLHALRIAVEEWPDTLTIAWQLGACLLVEDAMFYWTHRALHARSIYAYVHKVHHTFYHTVCWSSEMAHPIEYFFGNLLPVFMGALLLRSHMIVFLMFILVRIFVSVEEHCGYSFPWSPVRFMPFGATVEGHDYHHSRNNGMFASQFIFWDWLCGTDRPFQRFMESEEQLKKSRAVDEFGDPDSPAAPAPELVVEAKVGASGGGAAGGNAPPPSPPSKPSRSGGRRRSNRK